MLIEAIQFGGILFWSIFIFFLILFFSAEKTVSSALFVVFCIVMVCICNMPDYILSLKSVGLYLLTGFVYWFIMLNVDFYKLKGLAKKHNVNLANYYKGSIPNHHLPYDMKSLVLEPSLENFVFRILLFPIGIVSDMVGKIPEAIFNVMKSTFIAYRNSILGITSEMKNPSTSTESDD